RPLAAPPGRPGDGAPRPPLLLLQAKPRAPPPHFRPRARVRESPRHGRQSTADPAGDGRRSPGPDWPDAQAVRHPAATVRCTAQPRRPGLGPLVRPSDDRLRPEGPAAGPARLGTAVRLRSASGLARSAARPL